MITLSIKIDPNNQNHRTALDTFLNALSAKPQPAAKPQPQPAAKPQPQPAAKPTTEQPALTIDEIRAAVQKKAGAHRDAIVEKLSELGAQNVSTLAPESYQAFIAFLNGLA